MIRSISAESSVLIVKLTDDLELPGPAAIRLDDGRTATADAWVVA